MGKKVLGENEVIEQRVRMFQNESALNFPRAALRYLGVKPGCKLCFKILKPGVIEVFSASVAVVPLKTVVENVGVDDIKEFISRRGHRRP